MGERSCLVIGGKRLTSWLVCVYRLSANNAALQAACMTFMGEERGSHLGQLPAMVTECFYWILPPLRQMSKHFLQIGYQRKLDHKPKNWKLRK
jgi:hypothetical protein